MPRNGQHDHRRQGTLARPTHLFVHRELPRASSWSDRAHRSVMHPHDHPLPVLAQNSRSVSRRVERVYASRTRPRRCKAGTSPSHTSLMKRRLVRWNGVLIRNPSPPISSTACAILSAMSSGEPIRSRSLSKRSAASCRSVLPLPHCWNLSSEPCSPLVVSRPGSGLSRSYCEKSISDVVPLAASEASTKDGEVTRRRCTSRASRVVSPMVG